MAYFREYTVLHNISKHFLSLHTEIFFRILQKMLVIPDNLIPKFLDIASKNNSPEDGKHVETLAFLIGFEENSTFFGTDLYFPKQKGLPCQVHDKGKSFSICKKLNTLLKSFVNL